MPFFKDAMSSGNLYIQFEVEFPKKNEIKNLEALKNILPMPKNPLVVDRKQCEFLDDYDPTSTNPKAEGGRSKGNNRMEEEDEDEDGQPRNGQRVQCQQQ